MISNFVLSTNHREAVDSPGGMVQTTPYCTLEACIQRKQNKRKQYVKTEQKKQCLLFVLESLNFVNIFSGLEGIPSTNTPAIITISVHFLVNTCVPNTM